jgi:hypothetical protein
VLLVRADQRERKHHFLGNSRFAFSPVFSTNGKKNSCFCDFYRLVFKILLFWQNNLWPEKYQVVLPKQLFLAWQW